MKPIPGPGRDNPLYGLNTEMYVTQKSMAF